MLKTTLRRSLCYAAGSTLSLALLAGSAFAQDRDDHRRDRDDDHRGAQSRQHYDHPQYHFRTEDGERLASRYNDSAQWRDRRDRHEYYEGQRLEGDWQTRIRPVPQEYYRELPPPPPGYVFGYSDGYAVAYNPTTRIVADVIDLAAAATRR